MGSHNWLFWSPVNDEGYFVRDQILAIATKSNYTSKTALDQKGWIWIIKFRREQIGSPLWFCWVHRDKPSSQIVFILPQNRFLPQCMPSMANGITFDLYHLERSGWDEVTPWMCHKKCGSMTCLSREMNRNDRKCLFAGVAQRTTEIELLFQPKSQSFPWQKHLLVYRTTFGIARLVNKVPIRPQCVGGIPQPVVFSWGRNRTSLSKKKVWSSRWSWRESQALSNHAKIASFRHEVHIYQLPWNREMFAHPTCPNVPNHCRGNLLYQNNLFFLFHCLLQTNGPPDFQSNIHEKKGNQQTMPW